MDGGSGIMSKHDPATCKRCAKDWALYGEVFYVMNDGVFVEHMDNKEGHIRMALGWGSDE